MTWLALLRLSIDWRMDGWIVTPVQSCWLYSFFECSRAMESWVSEADVNTEFLSGMEEALRLCYVNPQGYLYPLLRRVIEPPNHPPRFLPVKYLRTGAIKPFPYAICFPSRSRRTRQMWLRVTYKSQTLKLQNASPHNSTWRGAEGGHKVNRKGSRVLKLRWQGSTMQPDDAVINHPFRL